MIEVVSEAETCSLLQNQKSLPPFFPGATPPIGDRVKKARSGHVFPQCALCIG
jgi:hypothetical protein